MSVFVFCLILGGLVLVAQIVLGLVGIGHHIDLPGVPAEAGETSMDDGLDLLSVRAVAAGAAVFGAAGLIGTGAGLPALLAGALAAVPGGAAVVGVAYLMRQMMRLESDGSIRLHNAVGTAGTAYLAIPAARQGVGLVQVPIQGRTVELRAVAAEGCPAIPTGAAVVVVAVLEDGTVEVAPIPTLQETYHDAR